MALLRGLQNNRPVILVACRVADSVDDPDVPVPVKNDLCLRTYTEAIIQAGGLPLLIPCAGNPEIYAPLIEQADGIMLPGGSDVNPQTYGEVADEKLGHLFSDLDQFDMYVAERANDLRIPMLGICRGMQVMNIIRGGSLLQDLGEGNKEHELHHLPRTHLAHVLKVEEESQFGKICKCTELETNSLHHQAVKTLGENLRTAAVCSCTGLIEILEDTDPLRFYIGVQSHPEELVHTVPGWRRLFEAFVDEARSRKFCGGKKDEFPVEQSID
eukprot:Gregarina_sp_Pseudo_9__2052@NODE_2422_length_1001_cov_98_637214_g2228_i0_p1_GENE_NODE_2422_length_1001_cov_98_637214_g2228_i0NODE_2422_length_1001_cov_98_637214_g2228_i0_p1_ORF_typecomplete_len271_score26_80Peptidase_C26/PF07722_13/2_9e53GATase/PF00117_28/1_9e11Arm/PF00514_23/0_14_NODE_2422_length_1001_cov_98_637214_g2228_i077889